MFNKEDLEKFTRENGITIDDDAMQALAEMFEALKDDEVEAWQGGGCKYESDSYSENLYASGDTVEEFIASAIKVLLHIVEGILDDNGNLVGWDFADIRVNDVQVTMNKQRHVYLQK